MSRCGDFYENRVTGERAVVLRGEEADPGQSALVHLTVRPGGAVAGEHIHPGFQERFAVVSGTLGTRVDGEVGTLTAGREQTVPAGTPHDWWNAGVDEASVIVELSPPDPRFEALIATLFGLANDGRTDARGMPDLLQLALNASEFSDVIRFTRPPRAVQTLLFGALGPVARRRGRRAVYPQFLHPHGRVTPDPSVMWQAGLSPA